MKISCVNAGLLLAALALAAFGCPAGKPAGQGALPAHLDALRTAAPYMITEFYSYSSSGGGWQETKTRLVKSEELSAIGNELGKMQVDGGFEYGGRSCYYGLYGDMPIFACFDAAGRVVDYVKQDGPAYGRWNAEGYPFDFKRSRVLELVPDLRSCRADADCSLTSEGVCDPPCGNNASAGCDSGYRTSINSRHGFLWDSVPLIADECIKSPRADYDKHEYFIAKCNAGACEAAIVAGK